MDITIYSTTTCSSCHTLTNWLDKQGVKYVKKITDEDPALMMEFMSVNDEAGQETKITGFDAGKFKNALNL
jgi:glutaredoxin 3